MDPFVEGTRSFRGTVYPDMQPLFRELAGGQQPEVLFITCSDSRIDPHLITQSKPGSLFVVRNAGNIVPAYDDHLGGEAGSIEYAVRALGVKHVVVCGHSRCGAMQGLLSPSGLAGLPAVAAWLKYAESTREALAERHGDTQGDALLDAAIRENVCAQLDHLRTHPAVREALEAESLEMHGWIYDIGTAEIVSLAEGGQSFDPINVV